MSDDIKALKLELADLAKTMKANHLVFAQGLARGESQEKAWVNAGSKAKNPNADAAKIIAKHPAIIQYKELFLKIAALEALPRQIATFEQKKQMLWDIANKCFEEKSEKWEGRGEFAEMVGFVFDSRGAIGAIAELNKMDGHLAAIKTDNKTKLSFEEMSDSDLNAGLARLVDKIGKN